MINTRLSCSTYRVAIVSLVLASISAHTHVEVALLFAKFTDTVKLHIETFHLPRLNYLVEIELHSHLEVPLLYVIRITEQ